MALAIGAYIVLTWLVLWLAWCPCSDPNWESSYLSVEQQARGLRWDRLSVRRPPPLSPRFILAALLLCQAGWGDGLGLS